MNLGEKEIEKDFNFSPFLWQVQEEYELYFLQINTKKMITLQEQ